MELTLGRLREVNRARRDRWMERDNAGSWSGADWSNEMCGEAGEAANVVKKLRRVETGLVAPADGDMSHLLACLADELADVLITVDLVAMYYGIDLEPALIRKFNRTSKKQNLPDKLP